MLEITESMLTADLDATAATVAEGIERPEQEAELRALGCRLGQGFLAPARWRPS